MKSNKEFAWFLGLKIFVSGAVFRVLSSKSPFEHDFCLGGYVIVNLIYIMYSHQMALDFQIEVIPPNNPNSFFPVIYHHFLIVNKLKINPHLQGLYHFAFKNFELYPYEPHGLPTSIASLRSVFSFSGNTWFEFRLTCLLMQPTEMRNHLSFT